MSERYDNPCGAIRDASGRLRWPNAPLARELFVINNLMTRCGDRLVADLGLTASRWKLLGAIVGYDSPPTLSDLSGDALLSVQNVSRMVGAMESDGLVERFTRSGRGRAVFVRVTEEGERVLNEARERAHRFREGFLGGFNADEVVLMQGLLDRMTDNLEAFERELQGEQAPTELGGRTA